MNGLRLGLVIALTGLVVFGQATVDWVRLTVGVQLELLPSLVVFCAARGDWIPLTAGAVLGGLWLDSLSLNALGTSVLPLLGLGWTIYYCRDLVLIEDRIVQAGLGGLGSGVAFGLGLLLQVVVGAQPLTGWITVWQGLVVAGGGAVVAPLWFWLIPWLEKTLGYSVVALPSFRPDREIKRGRF
jgi:hypothetical protein